MTFPTVFFRPFASCVLLTAFGLTGCGLQKDIDVPAPAYDEQLVVECALVPGEPYRLIVQHTQPFLAPLPQTSIDTTTFSFDFNAIAFDAVAIISGPRGADTIRFSPSLDNTSSQRPRGYTHTSTRIFDGQPGETYSLLITDDQGRRITGTTTVLTPVPIDTVEVSFNPEAPTPEEAKAAILTRFREPATAGDFYRYQSSKVSRGRLERQQSFEFDDTRFNGLPAATGSSYRFGQNDTLDVALYRIERPYYDYLESVDAAQGANGNPFAQPASIKSTITGGIGMFTNLSGVHRQVILKR